MRNAGRAASSERAASVGHHHLLPEVRDPGRVIVREAMRACGEGRQNGGEKDKTCHGSAQARQTIRTPQSAPTISSAIQIGLAGRMRQAAS